MPSERTLLFIGTYGEKLGHVDGKGEGVYVLLWDRVAGALCSAADMPLLGKAQLGTLKNPTYLCSHRDAAGGPLFLYIVDERYGGDAAIACAIVNEQTAELTLHGGLGKTGGEGGCHVSVAPGGRHVMVANYLTGSVAAFVREADGSLGSRASFIPLPVPGLSPGGEAGATVAFPGPNAGRQEQAHAHMVTWTTKADGSHVLLVPDLGCDCVWAIDYSPDADEPLRARLSPPTTDPRLVGGGPRHMVLHPTLPIAYVAYELTSQVAAFKLCADTGGLLGLPLPPGPVCVLDLRSHTAEAAAEALSGASLCSADPSRAGAATCAEEATSIAAVRISPKADRLYVSNRLVGAPGALSILKLMPDGTIAEPSDESLTVASTLGFVPRDFLLLNSADGESLVALAANQNTPPGQPHALVAISGRQAPVDLKAQVPTPVCVCVAPEEQCV